MINLRSDTQSLPTTSMRAAMADAELGDETYGEDPTVRRLEERVAELLGVEAALLVLSGTMANLVAVMTHCSPGDRIVVPADVHLLTSEAGGLARVAGTFAVTMPSVAGHLRPEGLDGVSADGDLMSPATRLVWIENTHNRAGGSPLDEDGHDRLVAAAQHRGIAVHVDGARLPNAAVAAGVDLARLAKGADSVYLDFTKGLSCPLGAALAGSQSFVQEARRQRRVLGGGMRQAGVIAAAALVALESPLEQISIDHETAQFLAEELHASGLYDVDPASVATNFVQVDVRRYASADEFALRLAEKGVLVSTRPPHQLRLVAYRQVTREVVAEAVGRMIAVAKDSPRAASGAS